MVAENPIPQKRVGADKVLDAAQEQEEKKGPALYKHVVITIMTPDPKHPGLTQIEAETREGGKPIHLMPASPTEKERYDKASGEESS